MIKATASIALVLFSMMASAAPVSARAEESCASTREYVTALEYLRSVPELQLPEAEARKIATRVSSGCSGAGSRFIRVTQLLTRAGFGSRDAVQAGIDLAMRTDRETDTFTTVFRYGFLGEYLDLDMQDALKLAHSLSTGFNGDVDGVREDFRRLVEFCVGGKGLDLPRPQCGEFAARVARKGQDFKGGLAPSFIQAFEFVRSKNGPSLTTADAVKIAEELVSNGPSATDNFIQGYRYGVSKSGLQLGVREAVQFGRDMALQSRPKPAPASKVQ